jgi:hypothetical protein
MTRRTKNSIAFGLHRACASNAPTQHHPFLLITEPNFRSDCPARCLLRTFFFDAKQSKFFPLNSFIHMSATAPVGGAAAASTATQTITATTPSLPPLPPTLQQIADPSLNASTCPLFSHCQPHFLSLEVCWHEQACCLSAVRENSSGVNG